MISGKTPRVSRAHTVKPQHLEQEADHRRLDLLHQDNAPVTALEWLRQST